MCFGFLDCSTDLNGKGGTHPDHIDTDKDVDWIVMWNALKHAHIWIKAGLPRDLLGQR